MLEAKINNLQPEIEPKQKWWQVLGKILIGFLRILPTVFVILGVSLIIIVVSAAVLILPYFNTLKSVYLNTHSAAENMKLAQNYLFNNQFEEAKQPISEAKIRFEQAQSDVEKLNRSFYIKIEYVNQQLLGVDDLLDIGVKLSDALLEATDLGIQFTEVINSKDLSLQKMTSQQKHDILGAIYNAGPQLEKIQTNLSLAMEQLDEFDDRPIFPAIRSAAAPIKENLPKYEPLFKNIFLYGKVLPELAGYKKQMNYLFLLENNDEIRPAGGFIGTYGVMQIKDVEFVDFFTDNIYKLDRPVEEILKIKPPEPITEHLKQEFWYMRDSNWWYDFPTSARNVESFYQKENGPVKDIDGVVAITQTFIEDLLGLTGPITVDGIEFNRDNFTDQLQFEVEKGYELEGIEEAERKAIISRLSKEIMNRILVLPRSEWDKLFQLIDDNFDEKHLMLYVKDQSLQSQLTKLDWSGDMYKGPADNLAIVDANLAALKTDSVMIKNYEYYLEEKPDELIARVKMTYENLGIFTWKTTRYRTYNRIYVPKGSQLISYREAGQLVTPEIYEELGKQTFAHFFIVEPKREKTLEINYKLPESVRQQLKNPEYSFFLDKQPGLDEAGLKVEMKFIKPISGVNENLQQFGQTVRYEGELIEDMEFRVEF